VEISGKTVLVTGASHGIGAATARAFADEGAHVLLVARSAEQLALNVKEIEEAGGKASAVTADLSDPEVLKTLPARIQEEFGVPDVLVNNAGSGRWLFLEDTEPDELLNMIAVPYTAALLLTGAFLRGMLARRSGWIVNVNSPVTRVAIPGALGYTSARWGVRGITESLRLDLRGTGVGISEVIPGKVLSNYFASNPGVEERVPAVANSVAPLTPEQVGKAIVRAVLKERTMTSLPWQLRAFELTGRILPGFPEWLNWRTGARR
jgi:NADP-dependent 3-hydroxy acid dehydrogenase YdfG